MALRPALKPLKLIIDLDHQKIPSPNTPTPPDGKKVTFNRSFSVYPYDTPSPSDSPKTTKRYNSVHSPSTPIPSNDLKEALLRSNSVNSPTTPTSPTRKVRFQRSNSVGNKVVQWLPALPATKTLHLTIVGIQASRIKKKTTSKPTCKVRVFSKSRRISYNHKFE